MYLHFETVDIENREALEALQLFPDQTGFIESVGECLAEADELKAWRPVGIYDGDTLVGFAMYGLFQDSPQSPRIWLDRLLIDSRYQRKGYGKASVEALLDRIQGEYKCREVYLSVYEENTAAIALYKETGFRFNGELDTKGEKIMTLTR